MAVSKYDKGYASMSDRDKEALAAAGAAWNAANAAGDEAGKAAAHQQAESIRAQYGYSGGGDGSGYIKLPSSSGGTTGTSGNKGSYTPQNSSGINYAQQVGMSEQHLADLQAAADAWAAANAAGDKQGMTNAHNWAETIRALYGYSGGGDGSDYIQALRPGETDVEALMAQIQNTIAQIQNQNYSYGGSPWDSKLDELAQAAIDFNYDDWTKSDQYSSLAERYGHEGKLTMQDVLGQISSRTGGLASSYAATAAQQQYNDYMAQLESVARGQFADEKGNMLENAQVAQTMSEQEYQRYLDELSAQQQGQSASLNALYELLGYKQQQENIAYDRTQTSRVEAQNRIYDYLVNQGGSVANLDADLITQSGYTTSELAAMEAQYKAAAAAAASKSSGSGGNSGGNSGTSAGESTESVYQKMYNSGIRSYDDAYAWLRSAGYGTTDANRYAEGLMNKIKAGDFRTGNTKGTSYNSIWQRAKTMYDQGKTEQEIMDYLDKFDEEQLTSAGLDYIMNSLNLGGYRTDRTGG